METPVDLGSLEFLVLFGEIEGQLFLLVLQPLIRAFIQQQFHDLGIIRLRCRLVEWRISCLSRAFRPDSLLHIKIFITFGHLFFAAAICSAVRPLQSLASGKTTFSASFFTTQAA